MTPLLFGANRTKVGLKQGYTPLTQPAEMRANRTKVGLKQYDPGEVAPRAEGANRTKVGLKHVTDDLLYPHWALC